MTPRPMTIPMEAKVLPKPAEMAAATSAGFIPPTSPAMKAVFVLPQYPFFPSGLTCPKATFFFRLKKSIIPVYTTKKPHFTKQGLMN